MKGQRSDQKASAGFIAYPKKQNTFTKPQVVKPKPVAKIEEKQSYLDSQEYQDIILEYRQTINTPLDLDAINQNIERFGKMGIFCDWVKIEMERIETSAKKNRDIAIANLIEKQKNRKTKPDFSKMPSDKLIEYIEENKKEYVDVMVEKAKSNKDNVKTFQENKFLGKLETKYTLSKLRFLANAMFDKLNN